MSFCSYQLFLSLGSACLQLATSRAVAIRLVKCLEYVSISFSRDKHYASTTSYVLRNIYKEGKKKKER
jgi:hypothetical protein